MLVIKTMSRVEVRIPLEDIDSITEIEPDSGVARHVPPHPHDHRAGVNRCAACWRPWTDMSHTDLAVHG